MNVLRALVLSAPLAAAFVIASPALAGRPDHSHDETDTHEHQNGAGHSGHGNGYGNGHHKTRGVPELDTSVAGSAAVLLGGGVFVLLGRRRASKR